MRIQLTIPYKSLRPFTSEELPDFTIIIGRNGSGKSQLVEKFNQFAKAKSKSEKAKLAFSIAPELYSVYSETLVVNGVQIGGPNNYRNQFVSLVNNHNEYINNQSIIQAENNMSLETQRKACEQYSKKNGYKIVAYFGDTYESAKNDERLEFNSMLSFVRKSREKIAYIIVFSVDRFSRSGANAIYITEQLKQQGISVLSAYPALSTSQYNCA